MNQSKKKRSFSSVQQKFAYVKNVRNLYRWAKQLAEGGSRNDKLLQICEETLIEFKRAKRARWDPTAMHCDSGAALDRLIDLLAWMPIECSNLLTEGLIDRLIDWSIDRLFFRLIVWLTLFTANGFASIFQASCTWLRSASICAKGQQAHQARRIYSVSIVGARIQKNEQDCLEKNNQVRR